MRNLKPIAQSVCYGILGAALLAVPRAQADEWNKMTDVTFNEPVEIPGMVLSPGKYVFKLMDSESDRNIVQIFSADQKHLYATILAIPDLRLHPTGKTVITFEERAKGSPEAIKAWFYPGDEYGQEFVYPRPRALELAKSTKQRVLAMPPEVAANIAKPVKSPQDQPVIAMKKAPVEKITPEQAVAAKAPAAAPAPASEPQHLASNRPRAHLPKTASSLPLLALIGLMSLGGALGLRAFARRTA